MTATQRHKRIRRVCIALKIRKAGEIMTYVYGVLMAGLILIASVSCARDDGYRSMREYAYYEGLCDSDLARLEHAGDLDCD